MSVWGKVIGGVAGFALGGPLGAIMGTVAGHAYDKMKAGDAGRIDDNVNRQVAFTTAVIVLSAKMAKADGRVTRAEVDAFKELFHIPPDEMKKVGWLFDEAKKDAQGFEPYAEQISMMFAHEPAVMEELLGGLFHIARADHAIHPKELEFLRKTALIFGFSEIQFERLKAIHMGPIGGADGVNSYQVLGLSREASDDEIKKTYRVLIRENHPDTLIAQGMPQEFIDVANEKMAAINAAYDVIEKERGLK
ncbi:MAG: molecular chaperone DjlA [Rhodospirillaceae bacterium]|jgi:DnaJ like chaperone protein|nr:molecular chaperone DjlA [Rhodospirillaceae bacterium]|tara:strand:- start:2650 stop:3396 length:747 start_codon:yes stop_codon:yes gene_type:complete